SDAIATDLAQLYKTLFLLGQFDLSAEETETLLANPLVFDLTPTSLLTPTLDDLVQLHDFVQLKSVLNDPGNRVLELMQVESKPETAIEALTNWQPSEILTLANGLGILERADYVTIPALTELQQGFAMVQTLGADAAYLIDLADGSDRDFAAYRRQADTLLELLRAQYSDEQWPQVFEPIHDILAEQQRDSLVAVALENLSEQLTGRKSPDVLYEYLLIDVQTNSPVNTSRIVQATASLQLYVQRCLMSLERDVDPSQIPQDEWLWMKNYRVWEVNRKVFLYPENFIEPELRNTKTPLFEELESELQQSDVDRKSAEAVYTRYLDKFAEVSNLTVVGSYLDTAELNPDNSVARDATLYLVGRNEATQEYYLRSMEQTGTVQQWKPWAKVDVPINARYVSPVVAFNKLFLFWAEAQESFITEDRVWINRTRNSNSIFDPPIDQLGAPIYLQHNTDNTDNIFNTVDGDAPIVSDTDVSRKRYEALIKKFNEEEAIDFPTVDAEGNEVVSLSYHVDLTINSPPTSARLFANMSGSKAVRANPRTSLAPHNISVNDGFTYRLTSINIRTLFPLDTYNDLDGGFINAQTFVVNDKHGVISQVNRPVKQPVIKYTYYNFSRTWVQPQTYLQLDVKLDAWQQRQPKWQRVYAQRWRESLGDTRQRPPEPIENLQVFQLSPNAFLEQLLPSEFSTRNLSISFWLRVNQVQPNTSAQPDRPDSPTPFELFSCGNSALRAALTSTVQSLGEAPQQYQAVDQGRAGLLAVRAAIAALDAYRQDRSDENQATLRTADRSLDLSDIAMAIGRANQAVGRITAATDPARQLAESVVSSARNTRAAIAPALGTDPDTALSASQYQASMLPLVTVCEQAIASAEAALSVRGSTDSVVPTAATALGNLRQAAEEATDSDDLTQLSTLFGQALTQTLVVLDAVQPALNQAEQFLLPLPKWILADPTIQLTLGGNTQTLLTVTRTTSDVDTWQHVALVLRYQTQASAYQLEVLTHTTSSSDRGTRQGTFQFPAAQLSTGQTLRVGAANNPNSLDLAGVFLPLQPWMSEFRWWNTVRTQTNIGRDRFDQQSSNTANLLHIPLDRQQSNTSQLQLVSDSDPRLPLQITFLPVEFAQSRERLLLLYGDVRTTAAGTTDGIIRTFRSNFADRRFNFFLSPNTSSPYRDLSLTEANNPYIGLETRQGLPADHYVVGRAHPLERYDPSDRQRIQQVAGFIALPAAVETEKTALAGNTANPVLLQDNSQNDPSTPQDDRTRLIESVETTILDVHNQPGWHVLDIGDSQFLVTVEGSNHTPPQTAEQRLDYVDPSAIQNTAAVDVGLRYGPDTLLNNSTLTFNFARLNTFAVQRLSDLLFAEGIDGLLSLAAQNTAEPNFDHLNSSNATGTTLQGPNDGNIIDFKGAYGIYYDEVFFHIPFLIANQLNANQKFAEAQDWYHYIFNPTVQEVDERGAPSTRADRYWRFRPFRNLSLETLAEMLTDGDALRAYREDPFDSHAIARLRLNTYQKAVVMKYIDNLLDWGDNLFRQDTRESINEAILLYVLAFNLLGPRPRISQTRPFETVGDYRDVEADLARSQITELPDFLANATDPGIPPELQIPFNPHRTVSTRFCTPENAQFIGYWDRVEDRLFKIRNSLNIDGVFRSLALFQPPIDPAALVNAVANGGLAGALASGIASGSQPV
ncbi:MAG: neuraminidase-like domain-containing protein, partial [Cyanobacteria bacterium P01_H01_bin.119]